MSSPPLKNPEASFQCLRLEDSGLLGRSGDCYDVNMHQSISDGNKHGFLHSCIPNMSNLLFSL